MESFQPLDLDFVPNAGASDAMLLQCETSAFLVFNAVRWAVGRKPREEFVAIFTFGLCHATRFGYPNDEPRVSIPRYKTVGADLVEVLQSEWAADVRTQNRIGFPDREYDAGRHVLFQFKDSTFECLCQSFEVEVTTEPRTAVIKRLVERLG